MTTDSEVLMMILGVLLTIVGIAKRSMLAWGFVIVCFVIVAVIGSEENRKKKKKGRMRKRKH